MSNVINKRMSTKEFFIEKAKKIHGDRYDYSESEYNGLSKKIKIKCLKHGFFEQKASNHLYWNGCAKCRNETRAYNKFNSEDILSKFIECHGDTYDYSLVNYIDVDTPVIIICRNHGEFKQTPYHHKKHGSGCPACTKVTPYSRSRYVDACNKYDGNSSLYILKMFNESEVFYKVGITNKTIKQRFPKNPYEIVEIRFITDRADYIFDLETQVHRLLAKYHYKPKIKFGGYSLECFSKIPDEILLMIDKIRKSNQLQLIA